MKSNKQEIYLILHDLRSSHNVGSIFRTADAAGVSKIYLSGTTPAPRDRFGRANKSIEKVALGAEKISWEKVKSINSLLKDLRKKDFQIIAIEQDKNSVDYKKIKIKKKTVLILGSEVDGLPKSVLNLCHQIAEIPMKGKKESLNVSVSAGIALFRILNI